MSTCEWLWGTEQQTVKLTVSDTKQNPMGDQNMSFEVFIARLPGDLPEIIHLGFELQQSQTETWMAEVVWEIEGGEYDGHLIIEILNSGKNGEDLPYVDETTHLRYWQVKVESMEETPVDPAFKLKSEGLHRIQRLMAEQYESMPEVENVDAEVKEMIEASAQLFYEERQAQARGETLHENDPEHPPFTDERGEFDPGD